MPEFVTYKCLRCGNEWRGLLDTDLERMCQVPQQQRAAGQGEGKADAPS